MPIQESALYGDLILYLRDYAANLLADGEDDLESAREELDRVIRGWFFTPQDRLHGCAPRELIWAEQKGEPNPICLEHLDDFFVDDCPICQAEFEDLQAALKAGEDPGWDWYYDDGGYPLIARYDPEGWDACWAEETATLEGRQTDDASKAPEMDFYAAEEYVPFPVESEEATPEQFVARLRQPWIDRPLHQAAQALTERLDCPEPSLLGLRYRPISYEEALSLLIGLHEHGVNVEMLMAQIEAFPYQNIALDWLSHPAENGALVIQAMERETGLDEEEIARLRHHRDFILALSPAIPPGAQLWLQGWLDAVAHGVLTRAVKNDEEWEA